LAISELINFRDTQPTYAPGQRFKCVVTAALTWSGSGWFATPFLYDSFIHYFTPVYPDAIQASGLPHSLFAHIYCEPNVTKRRPLITVPFETRLEAIAEPQDNWRWLEVRLPDDRSGWLQRGDVSFESQPLSIEAAID
jgi:hypothetical protein